MYQRYNPLLPASENPPLPSMEKFRAMLEEARLWAQSVGYKEEDVAELKTIIVQFLNTRLQREIDHLWADGTLTEEKMTA